MDKTPAKRASSARKSATKKVATEKAATRKVVAKKVVAKKVVAKKAAKKALAPKSAMRTTATGQHGNAIASNHSEASSRIDARIEELGDWRGPVLARVRQLIRQADPRIVEEVKWRGVPVWSHEGIICTGETYKDWVKMTFANGARLEDPAGLFNASLEGNTRRAIDIRQGGKIDGPALKALVRRAVAFNESKKRKPARIS